MASVKPILQGGKDEEITGHWLRIIRETDYKYQKNEFVEYRYNLKHLVKVAFYRSHTDLLFLGSDEEVRVPRTLDAQILEVMATDY